MVRRLRSPRARFAAAVGSIALASTVLAVSAAQGDAGSGAVHGTGDLTGSVLECSTDTVNLAGSYRYTESGFVNEIGNGTWFSHGSLSFELSDVVGTGLSGTSYRLVGASHLGYGFFFGSVSPGTSVENSTETWSLVPSDGGPPLSFREHFVFVVTPSGSTVIVDHGPGDCI